MSNYKGRENQKTRNCKCGILLTYSSYDSMMKAEKNNSLCKECQKNIKRNSNQDSKTFQKNCPECNCLIGYKSKYDYQTSLKKNSLCFECRGKKNLGGKGNLYERLLKKGISEEEAKERYKESEKKRLESRDGYRHSDETKKKISETEKGKVVSDETRKLQSEINIKRYEEKPEIKQKISDSVKKWQLENPEKEQKRREKVLKTLERKIQNGEYIGGLSKIYKIGNFNCQGTSEKYYIELLIENNEPLPKEVYEFIKTPFGSYKPDFEFEDHYIEIKSSYTLKVLLGLKEGWGKNKKVDTKQLNKILWVNENIKPIHLIILNKNSKKR